MPRRSVKRKLNIPTISLNKVVKEQEEKKEQEFTPDRKEFNPVLMKKEKEIVKEIDIEKKEIKEVVKIEEKELKEKAPLDLQVATNLNIMMKKLHKTKNIESFFKRNKKPINLLTPADFVIFLQEGNKLMKMGDLLESEV